MGGLALFEKGFHLVVGLEAMVQFGLQLVLRAIGRGEQEDGIDAIVRFALELLYLALTFHNELYHDALHATG